MSTIPRQVSCCCCDGWGCGSACLVPLSRQQGKGLKERRVGGAGGARSASPRNAFDGLDTCCSCVLSMFFLYLLALVLPVLFVFGNL